MAFIGSRNLCLQALGTTDVMGLWSSMKYDQMNLERLKKICINSVRGVSFLEESRAQWWIYIMGCIQTNAKFYLTKCVKNIIILHIQYFFAGFKDSEQ